MIILRKGRKLKKGDGVLILVVGDHVFRLRKNSISVSKTTKNYEITKLILKYASVMKITVQDGRKTQTK